MTAPSYEMIKDNFGWARVYWARGDLESKSARVNEVQNPPVIGWSHAIIIDGAKQCTIFCPFTFQSYQVSKRSAEYASLRTPEQRLNLVTLTTHLLKKWAIWVHLGMRRDFGMAAIILKAFGVEPPVTELSAGLEYDDFGDPIEPKTEGSRKGKQSEEEIKKLVKRTSKRGEVLAWFLEDGGGPKSIHAAMAVFKTTRSNILSHLFILQKDHGIGYSLANNTATVFVPGKVDPFIKEEQV
ncbi:hypothetical protein [Achromobacter xylosoxidans]|uniref:Uncharacterized protein n=1 Tax=Achromobacter phage JWX TaxID=1589746 RepID=A0A0B5A1Q0_9CAUD|nr:hypothetical protein [Achromobacter xylosoxidans]YP_009196227.1 hypothetical protein AVV28_gp42 [Achromobacter phage JWX]AJD82808.1 hypothetical protein JWX_00042 [Achromobacter phage JWX]WLW38461.1 hypothetical protein JWT_00037 [Achromobacter phage JWT]